MCRHLVGLLLLSAALLLAPRLAAAEMHVLSVGNNEGQSGEATLRFAERDASAMAGVLKRLGGVKPVNSTLMLGQSADRLRQTLGVIRKRLRQRRGRERREMVMLVYYSGHADARGLHLGDSTLPYDELRKLVQKVPAAVRVLIVDSCQSGGVTRVKGARAAKPFKIRNDQRLRTKGMVIISSSAAGEDSQESDRLGASFFTHHFINALRGVADDNADGRVTIAEAYSYAYHQTLRSSGTTSALQHPTFEQRLRGRGEVALSAPGRYGGNTGKLRLHRAGTYLLMRNQRGGAIVAELQTDSPGRSIRVPPGRYLAQLRGSKAYYEYEVKIASGGETKLSELPSKRVAYARLVRKGGPQRASHALGVLVGGRGEILEGHGPRPQLALRYTLELPWLTLGLRGRLSTSSALSQSGLAHSRLTELGLGLSAERYIDFEPLSVSFGLWGEASYLRQQVATATNEPTRHGLGGAFGGLFALERDLIPELSVRLEGGPMTFFSQRATTSQGAESGQQLGTPLTWWAAAGSTWRFH